MKKAVSLFSSGGIADMGFKKSGIEFIASNELVKARSDLYKINHPTASVFNDDIQACLPKLVSQVQKSKIYLLLATPPCQGMSSNGLGTLLKGIREGTKPKMDPRNELILPAIHVINEIRPTWIVFENVVNMKNTVIKTKMGSTQNILTVLRNNISKDYVGASYPVEFADYGLPQNRKRLITIYCNDDTVKANFDRGVSLIPPKTHNRGGTNKLEKWMSIKHALAGIERLDAKNKACAISKTNHLHRVGVLDARKYWWVANTKKDATAFDNQCINPECMFEGNPTHGTKRINNINQSKKDTPLFCIRCSSKLPRPAVGSGNDERIMKGFTSAYRRMSKDAPSSTITTNFSYVCSDKKIHPTENRSLSIYEAAILQSISEYDYVWTDTNGSFFPDSVLKDVIGESAPPMFFEQLAKWFKKISSNIQK